MLQGQVSLQFFSEYLDLVRFPQPTHLPELANYLDHKYSDTKIDLVICFGFPALQFWLDREPRLFRNVPVLFFGVEERRLAGLQLPSNVAGLTINFDDKALLALALRLHPRTTNVFLAGGTTDFERFWISERLRTLRSYKPRLLVRDLSALPPAEMAATLGRFQDLYRDAAGRYYQGREAVDLVCRSSNSPVYGFYWDYVGKGLVGGRVLNIEVGNRAAKMGMHLLDGDSPALIGVHAALINLDDLDGRQLTSWHIDKALLRPGSMVLFDTPSFWDLYKWRIVAIGLFCFLETMLLFALFVQLTRRKRADFAVQRLNGQLLNAQEEERTRIARELHDDVGQQLAVIGLGLSRLRKQIVPFSPAAQERVSQLDEKVIAVADSIRHVSHELHPAVLDHAGLAAALRAYCAEFRSLSGINVVASVEPQTLTVPSDIALCLYRISQEALNNIRKHSGATDATVRLQATASAVELTVSNNGANFDVQAARARGGLGLQSMSERARSFGGTLKLESNQAAGTILAVRIPLAKE